MLKLTLSVEIHTFSVQIEASIAFWLIDLLRLIFDVVSNKYYVLRGESDVEMEKNETTHGVLRGEADSLS